MCSDLKLKETKIKVELLLYCETLSGKAHRHCGRLVGQKSALHPLSLRTKDVPRRHKAVEPDCFIMSRKAMPLQRANKKSTSEEVLLV